MVLTRDAWRKYVLVKDDEVLDKLVDQVLKLNLVPLFGNGNQRGSEANGQVVRVHHIFIADKDGKRILVRIYWTSLQCPFQLCSPELGQVVQKCKQITHYNKGRSRPRLDEVSNLHHELVFRFQL